INLPVEAAYPDLRPFVQADLLAQARSQIETCQHRLAKANQELAVARNRVAGMTVSAKEVDGQAISAASPPLSSSLSHTASGGNSAAGSESAVSFEKEIKPVLEKNCLSCHNSNNGKSGLVLETVESILQGGNINGPAALSRRS